MTTELQYPAVMCVNRDSNEPYIRLFGATVDESRQISYGTLSKLGVVRAVCSAPRGCFMALHDQDDGCSQLIIGDRDEIQVLKTFQTAVDVVNIDTSSLLISDGDGLHLAGNFKLTQIPARFINSQFLAGNFVLDGNMVLKATGEELYQIWGSDPIFAASRKAVVYFAEDNLSAVAIGDFKEDRCTQYKYTFHKPMERHIVDFCNRQLLVTDGTTLYYFQSDSPYQAKVQIQPPSPVASILGSLAILYTGEIYEISLGSLKKVHYSFHQAHRKQAPIGY